MRKTLPSIIFIAACSAATSPNQEHLVETTPPTTSPESALSVETEGSPETVHLVQGETLLNERGLRGAFIARGVGDSAVVVASPELVDEPFVPASTFKIPNSLIGLETGVITDEGFTLPWDGEERQYAAWNRDHDLSSALEESVVWYYQEVARQIGYERMNEWVTRLDYGNADIGSEVDTFWLEGPLVITPREQLEFLEGLTSGRLGVSDRSVDILRRVMPSRPAEGATLRAKTGTALQGPGCHAWLVGWVEAEGEITSHFALLLLCEPDDVPSRTMRWELVEQLLAAAQMIEATSTPQ